MVCCSPMENVMKVNLDTWETEAVLHALEKMQGEWLKLDEQIGEGESLGVQHLRALIDKLWKAKVSG